MSAIHILPLQVIFSEKVNELPTTWYQQRYGSMKKNTIFVSMNITVNQKNPDVEKSPAAKCLLKRDRSIHAAMERKPCIPAAK